MTKKFNTAEEYLALPDEERLAIVKEIVDKGYHADLQDYTDYTEERELFAKLQEHYRRIENLAYAIGDEILAYRDEQEEDSDEWQDADTALVEFMSGAAQETQQQYSGEYMTHEDGFWIPSNC